MEFSLSSFGERGSAGEDKQGLKKWVPFPLHLSSGRYPVCARASKPIFRLYCFLSKQ